MSNIFVAKPLKNASIETAILFESRYDQKYAYIYIYTYIYIIYVYILYCSKEGCQLVLYVHSS